MRRSTLHSIVLIQRLGILMVTFTLCRLLFYGFNYPYFKNVPIQELSFVFLHGLRFDLAAIVYCNSLFILLHLIPFPFRFRAWYQNSLAFLFYFFNIPALAANFIDFIYFRFTLKRTTSDIFQWTGLGTELKTLIPKFIADFWYVFILFFILISGLIYAYKKTNNYLKQAQLQTQSEKSFPAWQLLYFVILALLFTMGVRGGLQLRPLSILSASDGVSSQSTALVLNTPFTLVQTLDKEPLKELNYMPASKAATLFNMHKNVYHPGPFKKTNVLILILESFSKEYVGALNYYKGHTPFLDSLLKQSLVFTNGFANGKRSIEGIPAVIAGIPTLMENPYITSAYAGNQINSLASLLKSQGYISSFFHGGTNGTMGFDNFTKMAGFENYYGRNEYNNEKDYDGTWGIYDEPFLNYMASVLNKTRPPFVSCCFTLSSHHPYTLPKQYENKFKKGTLEIHQSIEYADYSLKKFFETASKMPWFANTLFVITADHTSISEYPQYQTGPGSFRIPIAFYQQGKSLHGSNSTIMQQIDILPSVLELLNYPQSFSCMGESVFNLQVPHRAINLTGPVYQYIEGDYALHFDGNKSIGLYNYKSDTLLINNIVTSQKLTKDTLEQRLKAAIQVYNQSMLHNKLVQP
jgi:phosphoglycerol transferase MdoB-like AlkP superfamily enzyme